MRTGGDKGDSGQKQEDSLIGDCSYVEMMLERARREGEIAESQVYFECKISKT